MSPVEISVLLTQADRQAYLANWTQRMQARSASSKAGSSNPLSWLTRRFSRAETPSVAAPNLDAIVLGPCTLRFDAAGVRVRGAHSDKLYQWAAINEGTATAHHLFLWDEGLSGLMVPIRDLPAGMTVHELQKRLDAVWTAAKSSKAQNPVLGEPKPKAASVA